MAGDWDSRANDQEALGRSKTITTVNYNINTSGIAVYSKVVVFVIGNHNNSRSNNADMYLHPEIQL